MRQDLRQAAELWETAHRSRTPRPRSSLRSLNQVAVLSRAQVFPRAEIDVLLKDEKRGEEFVGKCF